MKSALLFCFASLLFVACTSGSTNDGSLMICRNLPSNSACSVDLAFLSCTYEDDAGVHTEVCLSDNVNQCPDGTGLGGCDAQCKPGSEYAAVCTGSSIGDAAPESVAPPSPSCRSLGNGTNAYCCPCGS